MTRFEHAMELFDRANAEDPRGEALSYSRRMTEWLERIEPDASEELRLATRSQHICRWMIPRETYPMTRAGYHEWRNALARFHAERAGGIMREVGYDDAMIAKVGSLLRKENLRSDAQTQTLEDAICLVFLENYLAEFAHKHAHEPDKLVTILHRTWRKMSPRGQAEAMKLPLGDHERRLIFQALNRTE
jgi:hypothetical protein